MCWARLRWPSGREQGQAPWHRHAHRPAGIALPRRTWYWLGRLLTVATTLRRSPLAAKQMRACGWLSGGPAAPGAGLGTRLKAGVLPHRNWWGLLLNRRRPIKELRWREGGQRAFGSSGHQERRAPEHTDSRATLPRPRPTHYTSGAHFPDALPAHRGSSSRTYSGGRCSRSQAGIQPSAAKWLLQSALWAPLCCSWQSLLQ